MTTLLLPSASLPRAALCPSEAQALTFSAGDELLKVWDGIDPRGRDVQPGTGGEDAELRRAWAQRFRL